MINIGNRIKQLRKEHGITQSELAESVNLSYQQIQKYENGKSSISVTRLVEICKALNTDISHFLKDIDNVLSSPEEYRSYNISGTDLTKEEEELIYYYRQIKSSEIKLILLKQLKGIIDNKN